MPQRQQNIRSEEVQDILTKVPHWMLRWGNIILLCLICLFFLFSWFIRYPEILYEDLILTTKIPPQKVFANTSATIDTLFIENEMVVKKGEIIGIIENTANLRDVLYLKEIMETFQTQNDSLYFPIEKIPLLSLGEISSTFAIFKQDYTTYLLNKTLDIQYNQIKTNKFSEPKLQLPLKSEKEIVKEKIKITKNNSSFKNLIHSLTDLEEALRNWEFKYLLKAKLDGKVSFTNVLKQNQEVNQGELLLIIVPTEKNEFVAKIKTQVENSVRIKKNQDVIIKLYNYPETEYGILKGKVESISEIPNEEDFYLVEASVDSPLTTSYKYEVIFKSEMKGTAGIVIEDLRLIERFFYQLRSIFTN